MLKTKDEIQEWLTRYNIKKYIINDNLTVDVIGNVNLNGKQLSSIDVQFNTVNGNFDCHDNNLTSLKGCPKALVNYPISISTGRYSFDCSNNKLTSLEYAPTTIDGSFACFNNQLTDLKGCPKIVNGNFLCLMNQLTTLKHIGTIYGELCCDDEIMNTEEYKTYIMLKHLRK